MIDNQLRVAREILFSPPVQHARRASLRWSAPLSPASLEAELQQATRMSKLQKVTTARAAAGHRRHASLTSCEEFVKCPPLGLDDAAAEPTAATQPTAHAKPPVTVEPITELQLHLSDPVADDEGASLLASAILTSAASLTSLKAFVQHVGDPGAEALAAALRTPTLALRAADMRFRNLAWSGAATLAQSLAHLPRLESLTLRCCSLGDEGTRWLCAALLQAGDRSRLTTLDINENGITDVGCLALGQLLTRHRSLTSLSAEENEIGTRGAYVLGKALSVWQTQQHHNKAPTRANDRDPPASPPRVLRTPSVATSPTRLQTSIPGQAASIFFSPRRRAHSMPGGLHPFPTPAPFTPLPPTLTKCRTALDDTDRTPLPRMAPLDDTIEEEEADDEAVIKSRIAYHRRTSASHDHSVDGIMMRSQLNSAFLAALDTLPASTSAANSTVPSRAHSRQTSVHALPAIPDDMSDNSEETRPCALRVLNLRYNKIDVNDMSVTPSHGAETFSHPQAILARYLTVAPDTSGLVSLDLSLNSMGDEGAVVLARSLAHNLSLTSLNVGYCHISDRGGVAIARALAFNTTLTALHLSVNYLTTVAATSFSDSISINPALRTIDLSLNLLDDASVWSICDALATNTALTHLDLHSNFISDEGAAGLSQACLRNRTIAHVNVDQNPMTDEGIDTVQIALTHEQR